MELIEPEHLKLKKIPLNKIGGTKKNGLF